MIAVRPQTRGSGAFRTHEGKLPAGRAPARGAEA